ncbi:hypothetical protein K0M31_005777 [Melipona bicolor]|uniref:Uncharacterized protein n=1 Tax=Melipona bicolor TaxID=60889 RepID=A0AA40FUT7_9HYME|nr:hypothetical protein K0M31_005777 [Melipona bicolor]
MEDVNSRRMAGAEDARMGCENVGTSATSLPLEIINPVKSTKSYSLLLHTDCARRRGAEEVSGSKSEE